VTEFDAGFPGVVHDSAGRVPLGLASLATLAQLVEHTTENRGVPSSTLGGGTILCIDPSRPDRATGRLLVSGAGVAQLVEHVTRNDGVTGSIPVTSSISSKRSKRTANWPSVLACALCRSSRSRSRSNRPKTPGARTTPARG